MLLGIFFPYNIKSVLKIQAFWPLFVGLSFEKITKTQIRRLITIHRKSALLGRKYRSIPAFF